MIGVDLKQVLVLVVCVGGIYTSYLTQGIVYERIATSQYEFEGTTERFENLIFLNFVQSCAACLFGFIVLGAIASQRKNVAPHWDYILPAVTNCIGPSCGTQALKNVSYPAQVLAKSCKMIAVMIMGFVIKGQKYPLSQWLQMFSIAGGISLFALTKDSKKASDRLMAHNPTLGYSLLFINLAMDGYTNVQQDAIKKKYPKTTSFSMMAFQNLWCSILYFVAFFLVTNIGKEALAFIARHPQALVQLGLFTLCGVSGQIFIFACISTFGSLVNTTITTTRKFMNILLSVFLNGTTLKTSQWAGVNLVFTGLFWNILSKYQKQRAKDLAVNGASSSKKEK